MWGKQKPNKADIKQDKQNDKYKINMSAENLGTKPGKMHVEGNPYIHRLDWLLFQNTPSLEAFH